MKLREKWNSQKGASILMALLFLLVSIMVSSSVLMAAASNGGKLVSNRKAQQRYLALSSAICLICDELAKAQYYGKYTYEELVTYQERETETEGEAGMDPGLGGEDGERKVEAVEYRYTQTPGDYCCELKEVLPLLDDFDYMFAQTFPPNEEWEEAFGEETISVKRTYEPLSGLMAEPHGETDPYKLTLKIDPEEGAKWNEVSELKEEVLIEIWLSHISENGYTLRLRASLGEADERGQVYKMEAELTQTGTVPTVNDSPGESGQEYQGGPMTWTLGWIAKEEADGA